MNQKRPTKFLELQDRTKTWHYEVPRELNQQWTHWSAVLWKGPCSTQLHFWKHPFWCIRTTSLTLGFSKEATVGQPDEAAVTQTRSIGFLFRKLNWLVVILPGSHLFLQGLFERSSPLQEVQSLWLTAHQNVHPGEWGRLNGHRPSCWYILISFQ